MGYHTDFSGSINIEPPLNAEEIAFLEKFNKTRRMDREQGPYYVEDNGDCFMQVTGKSGIRNVNKPPAGQPGLWCQWAPSENGTYLEWDQGEKFYDAEEWMEYLIDYFLKPGCRARSELPFLQANHICNGEIRADGEEHGDIWKLVVKDNVVKRVEGAVVFEDEDE